MKYIAVLGRLPRLSIAELETFFSDVQFLGASERGLAVFEVSEDGKAPEFRRFGGSLKFGEEIPGGAHGVLDWLSSLPEGKITLGVSDFRSKGSRRKAQEEALRLKRILQRSGRSVRVLENKEAVLSTATSHHNQLAEKKNHVEIMMTDGGNFKLSYVQNITDYAKRDQARPARDAKVGMLPPKLAQILINLLGEMPRGSVLLDPFCGTGVVLQEASLDGFIPYGTDVNERMVEYSRRNLEWLGTEKMKLEVGDATEHKWSGKIGGVAAEIFLGSPMAQVPGEMKLKEEKEWCRGILLGFLKNLLPQIESGAGVVLAIPAWRRASGRYETLGILDEVQEMGYNLRKYRNSRQEDLLYYREGQVVAREIIVLRKK